MKYFSTRGGVENLTFEDALFSGYASDGGLLLPAEIPPIDRNQLKRWSLLPYTALVKDIVTMFISETEISRSDINTIIDKAFSRFTKTGVVEIVKLKEDLNILELFHGPTLAFKDLALSCVGQMLEYFLEKRKKHITALVGTSGDTGSAAIESVRGLSRVDIIVLLPKSLCTRVQELQMTTVMDNNVHVYRVEGSSDDVDKPIKRCLVDSQLASKHNLCSINSINWARILIQIVHYFYAYLQLCPSCDDEVEIVVPTGAIGNATAGLIAREMGLPIKLVCAVSSNDIIDRAFSKGDFSTAKKLIETLATAMNIQVPFIERILYLTNGHDSAAVRQFMEEFERTEKAEISPDIMKRIQIKSCTVDDAGIVESMQRCWQTNNYLLCPHTAVAAKYHYDTFDREGHPTIPRVCIATASPAKFEEAVQSAGLTPQPTESIKALSHLPTKYSDMTKQDDWEQIIRDKLEEIYKRCQ